MVGALEQGNQQTISQVWQSVTRFYIWMVGISKLRSNWKCAHIFVTGLTLNMIKDYWLTFGGKSKKLVEGFCDADWASQKDQHLILGYAFYLGSGAITWSSKKQHIIALSSTESEYIAQTHAVKEALWLWSFINEIQGQQNEPVELHWDNQGDIVLAKDNKYHSWMKHIDLRFHFIREAVEDNKIMITYLPTEENVADIFTKVLPRPKFKRFRERLGLRVRKEGDKRRTKD